MAAARSSRSAIVALVLVLVFGTYIRLAGLGTAPFWNDELFHVFAAQSLDRGDVTRLPSGEVYRRGEDITRLVRVASHYVADPEMAARLPSAIFGVAGLVIFALIAWRVAGAWSAVWSAFLLGVFPVVLMESRNTRFYTEQLVLGLIAMYAGWRALAPAGPSTEAGDAEPNVRTRWGWVALTFAAFAVAARVQLTTLSVAAGWAGACALFAVLDLRRLGGRRAIRESVPVQLATAGIAGFLAVLVVRPGTIRDIVTVALEVPLWARGEYSPQTYYWMLLDATPLIVSLMPLIFLVAIRRNWALAVYLAMWFGVPFVLHSLVFRFQNERYVILALPALFLATGIAAAEGCRALRRVVATWVERRNPRGTPGMARLIGASAVVLVAMVAIVTTPAVPRVRRVLAGQVAPPSPIDWAGALAILHATPGADSMPWGSFHTLAAKYYWKRVDFSIEPGLLERPIGGPNTPGPRPQKVHPQGTPDWYVGVPVLSTADAIREHFGVGRDVIIAIDSTIEYGGPGTIMAELREGNADELCEGRCGTLHLYRWTVGNKAGRSSP